MKLFFILLFLLIGFLTFTGTNLNNHTVQENKTQSQAAPTNMKSMLETEAKAIKIRNEKKQKKLTTQQPKLEKLIKSYADAGMFYKIQYTEGIPYVWTNDVFNMLTIDNKNTLLGIIYLYYHNANSQVDRIYLHDAYNGKNVGNFRPSTGIIIY